MTAYPRAGFFASMFAIALASVAAARGGGTQPRTHLSGRYYDVETTVVHYNLDSGDFTAPERITITRPGLDAAADSAKGNMKTGAATLHGNVRVHDTGGADSLQGKNTEPATLTCDQLDVDGRASTYHASGRPHYESGARSADADDMLLDRKQGMLHLAGHAVIKDGGQSASSNSVEIDLKSGDVHLRGKPVQLQAPVTKPSPASKATPSPRPKQQ